MNERYVVVGLAGARSKWFSDLTRWSTSSLIPVDYVKAISPDEVRAILGSGRQVSALVVDAGVPGVDRELFALALESRSAVLVVAEPGLRRDWTALGAAEVLDDDFTPEELTEALRRCARILGPTQRRSSGIAVSLDQQDQEKGSLIAVTGPGGSGASTVAMSLAQSLSEERTDFAVDSDSAEIALVDGARNSQLALYHDVGDVIPGLPELVEAHRGDQPDPQEIRNLLFKIPERGYDLLLGIRRARSAASMAPLSTVAAVAGLRRSYGTVIADIDPDLDGESTTGSIDIENYHGVSRSCAEASDLVLLVVRPDMKGLHDLNRLVDSFAEFGVERTRLVPVLNHSPRNRMTRSALTRTVAELTSLDDVAVNPPIFLPSLRSLEDVHGRAARFPAVITGHLGKAVSHLLETVDDDHRAPRQEELGSDSVETPRVGVA